MNQPEPTTDELQAVPESGSEGSRHVGRNILIALGGVLAATAVTVWVLALVNGGIDDRTYTPATAQEIPDDGYELGIGDMTVDLRNLDWKAVVALDASVGLGRLDVLVPPEVTVAADAHVQGGEAVILGEREDGWDTTVHTDPESSRSPRLELDADVEAGQVRVID